MSNKSQLKDNNSLLRSILSIVSNRQNKEVTAGTEAITVERSDGGILWSVKVNPTPSQSKTVTPSESKQTVLPDDGMLLSSVDVEPISVTIKSGSFTPASSSEIEISNPFGSASKVKAVFLHINEFSTGLTSGGTVIEYLNNVTNTGFNIGITTTGKVITNTANITVTDSTIKFERIGGAYGFEYSEYSWEVIGYE